jgi:hypothetical protein
MIHFLPAEILLEYPLTFLKPGESRPGFLEERTIVEEKKLCRLVTILNAKAIAIEGVHWNLN